MKSKGNPINLNEDTSKYYLWVSFFGFKYMKYFDTPQDAYEYLRANPQKCLELDSKAYDKPPKKWIEEARTDSSIVEISNESVGINDGLSPESPVVIDCSSIPLANRLIREHIDKHYGQSSSIISEGFLKSEKKDNKFIRAVVVSKQDGVVFTLYFDLTRQMLGVESQIKLVNKLDKKHARLGLNLSSPKVAPENVPLFAKIFRVVGLIATLGFVMWGCFYDLDYRRGLFEIISKEFGFRGDMRNIFACIIASMIAITGIRYRFFIGGIIITFFSTVFNLILKIFKAV